MRVLFSSTSGHGHVIPMLPLARAFLAAGNDVRWALAAQATSLVREAGVEPVEAGAHGEAERELREAVRAQADEMPGGERAAYVFPRMFGETLTPPMVEDLLALVDDWPPDLMVHEHAELAAPLVGALRGVPTVTHSFGTAVPAAILEETTARLAELWHTHGLDIPPHAGCYRAGYIDICPPSLQTVPVGHIPDVHLLRPVDDAGPAPAPPEPLVYVTMGTVQNRPDLLREVVAGVAGLSVPVLVAVGPETDPAQLGAQPDHVRVERWVDQPAVLRTATAVVSHGGSGTFLASLARGLPQLCLPQAADQFRNAEGGVRAGAALALEPSELSPARVREAAEQLLVDPRLRSGAARVAAEIAAMPGPGAVAHLLGSRFGRSR